MIMENQEYTYAYYVHTIDLTVARNDSQIATGLMNCVLVRNISDANCNLQLKFDKRSNQGIILRTGDTFNFSRLKNINEKAEFSQVFISNTAVGVGTATLVFSYNIEIERLLRLTADMAQEAILQQQVTVANIATAIPAAALQNRTNIMIYNGSGNTIWVGSGTVTVAGATQGLPVLNGANFFITIAEGITLYAISVAGGDIVNVLESA